MTGRILIVLTALTVGLAGCAATSGVITKASGSTGLDVGVIAPDVQYTSKEGRHASFHKVRQPIAVVAFVAPEGDQCCWLDPGVVNIADQVRDLPVTVAQFSLPTSKCPHGPGCVEVCSLHAGRVMSLCDAQRLAWNAYGKPASDTLILIGQDNEIVMKGSLDDPEPIVVEARRLGQIERDRHPEADRFDLY